MGNIDLIEEERKKRLEEMLKDVTKDNGAK